MSYETKGLDAAQIAYDNYTPGDESPLYRCDSCGGEIYEGEECYYNGYTEKWYCDGCVCKKTAEREEEY